MSPLDALTLSWDSVSTTSIAISWTLAEGVTATSYNISTSNINCPNDTYPDITTSNNKLKLTGLEEGMTYNITVTTLLMNGIIVKYNITDTTTATG